MARASTGDAAITPVIKARSVPDRTPVAVVTDNPFVCSYLCEGERGPSGTQRTRDEIRCDQAARM
jgi:hypothetical protein